MQYPIWSYPDSTVIIPSPAVGRVLAEFRRLRHQDPQVCLRTGPINIISGTIGLRFSCDGCHYLDYAEFLRRAHEMGC